MIKAEKIEFIKNKNIPLEKPEHVPDLWWNIFDGSREYIEKVEITLAREIEETFLKYI
jgi:hypothetical protein